MSLALLWMDCILALCGMHTPQNPLTKLGQISSYKNVTPHFGILAVRRTQVALVPWRQSPPAVSDTGREKMGEGEMYKMLGVAFHPNLRNKIQCSTAPSPYSAAFSVSHKRHRCARG